MASYSSQVDDEEVRRERMLEKLDAIRRANARRFGRDDAVRCPSKVDEETVKREQVLETLNALQRINTRRFGLDDTQRSISKADKEAIRRERLLEQLESIQMSDRQADAELETEYVMVQAANSGAPRAKDVSVSVTQDWLEELLADSKNRLAISALSNNDPKAIISSFSTRIADTQTFNVAIPFEGRPVTNQRASGRCWLFASTNVFRIALMKKFNLEKFELSQAYLFYWDKLEKASYFLENVMETLDEPLDSRIVQELFKAPVSDGGQWDMVANLVGKYGLVPQTLYPDSWSAMNSAAMGGLITTKLRENALRLREIAKKDGDVKHAKYGMMKEIHLILTLMLGPPPRTDEKFVWEYYDKDKKYHKLETTPLEFASELSKPSMVRICNGTDVTKLFSLVNDPRHEYEILLTVDRLGNVWGGRPITYVNVKMSTLKAACIDMIKNGFPVFFGSDVGKYSDSKLGIMDPKLFDYELGFNVRLGMDKAERLQTHESAMTHAMVLTAVELDKDGNSVRWRVENSWSETAGTDGYFVMSDRWMDEFVYQAVVSPKFVSERVRDVLETKPKVLPLWDPMGALA